MKCYIITGSKNSGKTNTLEKLVAELKNRGQSVSGFISKAEVIGDSKEKYFLRNVCNNEKILLCSKDIKTDLGIGQYYFKPETIKFGLDVLKQSNNKDIIIIDEIGKLELKNQGWSEFLDIYSEIDNSVIISVRKDSLVDVIEKWNINYEIIIDLDNEEPKLSEFINQINEYSK